MHTTTPFKERLIQYRMESDDRALEPAHDPSLAQSIRLGALAGFGVIACAVVAFMLAAGYL